MTTAQMIALSLGLSVVLAAVGGLAALLLQTLSPDPRLRERGWSLALWAPALVPLATLCLLVAPAPKAPAVIVGEKDTAAMAAAVAPPPPVPLPIAEPTSPVVALPDMTQVAEAALILAAAATGVRLVLLAIRAMRLRRLIRRSAPAGPETEALVAGIAAPFGLRAPATRIAADTPEALLAGLARPILILPPALIGAEAASRAIIAHELAHLRRRDHQSLWLEEALLAILAINPLLPLIRAQRAAAREEACDALALSDASPDDRRAYAQSLIEALRRRAAAPGGHGGLMTAGLTFTGARRNFAMQRLKAVLSPAPTSGRRVRALAIAVAAVLFGLVGAGSLAVAAQRQAGAGEVILDETAGQSASVRDWAWTQAALNPVFKTVWPEACGFGADDTGAVYIHLGKGCTVETTPDPVIVSLAGVDPKQSPRDAFAAVKAACDTGRTTDLVYRQGTETRSVRAACPVSPVEPAFRELEIVTDFSALQPMDGDLIMVSVVREIGDTTLRAGQFFDLTPGQPLPSRIRTRLDPAFFTDSQAPTVSIALSGHGGIRASSGARPTEVNISNATSVISVTMRPFTEPAPEELAEAEAADARILAANAMAVAALTAEQKVRFRDPTATELKIFCASADAADTDFCARDLYATVTTDRQPGTCAPVTLRTDWHGETLLRARRAVARVPVAPGQSRVAFARAALKLAFPCGSLAPTLERGYRLGILVVRDGATVTNNDFVVREGEPSNNIMTRRNGDSYGIEVEVTDARRDARGLETVSVRTAFDIVEAGRHSRSSGTRRLTLAAEGGSQIVLPTGVGGEVTLTLAGMDPVSTLD